MLEAIVCPVFPQAAYHQTSMDRIIAILILYNFVDRNV